MRVPIDEAAAVAARLLEAAGATPEDARLVAASLVAANRAGHDGHGLARLPGYARRLRGGGTVSGPWRLERADGPIERYDGRDGLGHVHLAAAVERAVVLGRAHGLAAVGVASSNHAGALGPRARDVARAGLVGLLVTNAPAVLAPPGGARPVVGTNPLALAAPVPDGPPVVCDLSTSQVSRGRIMLAAQRGEPLEPGWAADAAGAPTVDAAAALEGTLAPLGGPKGFALALAVEILTGVLLGPAVGPDVEDFFGSAMDRPQGVSHLVLALDPARFGDTDGFGRRMARLVGAVLGSGEPGATRLPGSRAAAAEREHADLIEIGPDLLGSLAAEAAVSGVTLPARWT